MTRLAFHAAAAVTAAGALLLAPAARAASETFSATLSSAQEVPPKTSGGKGDLTATLDSSTKMLSWQLNWSGLTGPATMEHFHGPAASGANAGVVVPLGTSPAGPIKGTSKLTDAQIAELEAGKWYVNVHTAANPGGEIRGQVEKK